MAKPILDDALWELIEPQLRPPSRGATRGANRCPTGRR